MSTYSTEGRCVSPEARREPTQHSCNSSQFQIQKCLFDTKHSRIETQKHTTDNMKKMNISTSNEDKNDKYCVRRPLLRSANRLCIGPPGRRSCHHDCQCHQSWTISLCDGDKINYCSNLCFLELCRKSGDVSSKSRMGVCEEVPTPVR